MLRVIRRSFTSLAAPSLNNAPESFAGLAGLRDASDWARVAAAAVEKCQGLVDAVVTSPPSPETVRLLDDISDTLCQVLDPAEFCRNVHSQPAWRQAAERVCLDLGAYVQQLNMNYAIYTALLAALPPAGTGTSAGGRASASPAGRPPPGAGSPPPSGAQVARPSGEGSGEGWSEETLLVGRMLKRDFERFGVHLPAESQDRMAALVGSAQAAGMRFTRNLVSAEEGGEVVVAGDAAHAVGRLPQRLRRLFRPRPAPAGGGGVAALAAPGAGPTLDALLRGAGEEAVREAAYRTAHTHPTANLALLDQLVEVRHEVAALAGFPSFAAYQLDGASLAGRPQAVGAFLSRLSDAIASAAAAEAEQLRDLKRRLGGGAAPVLQPWDRFWLLGIAKAAQQQSAQLEALEEYLTVDGCIAGVGQLLQRGMGLVLSEEAPAAGEAWAPGVKRLVAHHPGEGAAPLGVIYLDLAPRAGKFPGAAHFTLRCGRRRRDGAYQTPVVAIVASVDPSKRLSHGQAGSLLHEFGHALHSVLSRTQHQHLSGTRGPQDLVELPSHVFEAFASEPAALALLARHPATGEPPPAALLRAAAASRGQFAALEVQPTVLMCLVDQLLHGESPPVGAAAARAVADITARHSAWGHMPGTHPHLRLNHLVGYGATYYSYLYAQCLAASLWERRLAPDPCGQGAGELLRRGLLEPGGAKEAARYVSDLFAEEPGAGAGVMTAAEGGGQYPDPGALLRQLGLER